MRQLSSVVGLVALLGVSISAQGPQEMKATLQSMQQQIDTLRFFLQLQTPGRATVQAAAHLDYPQNGATVPQTGEAFVMGWGLACGIGPSAGQPAVFVDGLPVGGTLGGRMERQDVQQFAERVFCVGAPLENGILYALNFASYSPDVLHTIKLRVYDVNGQSADSNEITVRIAK